MSEKCNKCGGDLNSAGSCTNWKCEANPLRVYSDESIWEGATKLQVERDAALKRIKIYEQAFKEIAKTNQFSSCGFCLKTSEIIEGALSSEKESNEKVV